MTARLVWNMRSRMSPDARRRARLLADRLLAPIGSIGGALNPSAAVAITFDDGPDPDVTPRLLDLLSQRGSRATFFVVTDSAARWPDLVRRMAAEGHEVALHADRHDRLTQISLVSLWRRVRTARQLLERLAGRPVRFFRPPFGAQSLCSYLVARACGLDVVVWGPYAADWAEGSPEAAAARGLAGLRGGDILLLHDGLETPVGEPVPTFDRVRMFELILDGLAARGFRAATVGELICAGRARRTAWFRP